MNPIACSILDLLYGRGTLLEKKVVVVGVGGRAILCGLGRGLRLAGVGRRAGARAWGHTIHEVVLVEVVQGVGRRPQLVPGLGDHQLHLLHRLLALLHGGLHSLAPILQPTTCVSGSPEHIGVKCCASKRASKPPDPLSLLA